MRSSSTWSSCRPYGNTASSCRYSASQGAACGRWVCACVGLGDRRKAHHLRVFLGQHMAGEVVFVQPVHDQHDRASRLVVEPAVERRIVPFVGALPVPIGQRLLGLQRVVDDDQIGAAPGQHAADRGGDAAAPRRRLELGHRLPQRREARREQTAAPRARDDAPAIARPFVGEILARGLRSRRTVAVKPAGDAQDLGTRRVAEDPGRKGDRGRQDLEDLRICFSSPNLVASQRYLIVKLSVRKSAKSVIVTIPKVAQTSGIRRFALWALGFNVSLVTTIRSTPPRAAAIRKGS